MSELVVLNDLSRRLRVPARWLRAEAAAGRLPHVTAGHQILFEVATVKSILAARAAKEGAPRELPQEEGP